MNDKHILILGESPAVAVAKDIVETVFDSTFVMRPEEALLFLAKNRPDLILLDLQPHKTDGISVLKQLKEDRKSADIPIVCMLDETDAAHEVLCIREGAHDCIRKPLVAEVMLQRLRHIVELDLLQKNLENEVERQTGHAKRRREKVERLSMQIMLTLAETIDAKDKYTNGHSLRVAGYAREIARRAGKSKQEQKEIYFIGLLHDIGKIGIPNTIINKSSGLTEEEYEIMKDHPQIGADILENMTEIPGLAVGARWHHELYDGTGYPDGLKGENIPEIARLIGVSDAYDAMTSKRSYRDVMPQERVKEELKKGRGTQFDPYYADIMLQMVEEDTEYRMCARDAIQTR